jgi:DNA polymerase V
MDGDTSLDRHGSYEGSGKGGLRTGGIVDLTGVEVAQLDELLGNILVEDLWGIGSRLTKRLNALGIMTARTLKAADHIWLRQQLGVTVQRIVLLLRGISCLPIQPALKPRQAMMVSPSDGSPNRKPLPDVRGHRSF